MNRELHVTWTTRYEINHINGIGGWATECISVRSKPRSELITLYLAAAKRRDRWDGIDPAAVIACAEEALRHAIEAETAVLPVVDTPTAVVEDGASCR